jgi:hypothetical protein
VVSQLKCSFSRIKTVPLFAMVKVTLRLTVGQSAHIGVDSLGAHDHIFDLFRHLRAIMFAPSDAKLGLSYVKSLPSSLSSIYIKNKTPWSGSGSELYPPSDRRLFTK